ncbi:MAG: SIS domain-containing protein [Bifidobacteriaceae bacterium]|jgi:uncharacterized phosphosugar-binding protein|nr:SIS domain-containing protein [Bifidobacteriaceae bacterium]
MNPIFGNYFDDLSGRIGTILDQALEGGFDEAISLMAQCLGNGGVLQAFGTGHSEAFAMEMAGRVGGFIATHPIRLVDLVVLGGYPVSMLGSADFERRASVADDLWRLYEIHPEDAFLIASNSGANGATVGLALRARREGHPVIAVTSLEHSRSVASRHPSGLRLFEIADVVLDNRAPYGDSAIPVGAGPTMGPVSSITAAFIAQLLTLGTAERLLAQGKPLNVFRSSNISGGDEHNAALQGALGRRVNSYLSQSDQDRCDADEASDAVDGARS